MTSRSTDNLKHRGPPCWNCSDEDTQVWHHNGECPEADDLDLDEYEDERRRRLAEQNEY